MYKLAFKKIKEPDIRLPTTVGYRKGKRVTEKMSTSASLTMPKPLTVWTTTNWKILGDGNTRLPDLPPEKSVCRS